MQFLKNYDLLEALELPRMPCDPAPDIPTTHSKFGIIWGNPEKIKIIQPNQIIQIYTKLTRRSVWGIDKRSFTKVFKALSRASSPYNLCKIKINIKIVLLPLLKSQT